MTTPAPRARLAGPISPRMPEAGPILLTIPGVSDVPIAAATVGPAVRFIWPGPWIISGLWLGASDGSAVSAAALRLRMQDVARQEIIADGQGSTVNAPGLAFMGRTPRWQPFRRVVRAGQTWFFQITNTSAGPLTPQLYLRLEVEGG